MTKKDKIWIGAVVLLLILDAIYMVMIRDWVSLLWIACAAFLFYLIVNLKKECMDRDEHIRFLTENNTTRRLRQSMREARISAENCYRYINTIKLLKEENERLKILNKNLIENKNTGVKNYARKRK